MILSVMSFQSCWKFLLARNIVLLGQLEVGYLFLPCFRDANKLVSLITAESMLVLCSYRLALYHKPATHYTRTDNF